MALTDDIPARAAARAVPLFCRLSIEAACTEAVRRRRIGRGESYSGLEETLFGARTLLQKLAPANPDPAISLPVHQIMLVVNGIHLVERMKLDELAASGVYEFAFIVQPLKIQGATGSTVVPVAVY